MIGSSDPQIGANQLEFNYQEIEHTLVSVETGGCLLPPIALGARSSAPKSKSICDSETRSLCVYAKSRFSCYKVTVIDSNDLICSVGNGIYLKQWWAMR